jgi:sugar-specific transcriptional regulator TrmB
MREKLIGLGFTNNEVIIYEILCKYEALTANELAQKSGIDRSVTYNLLTSLNTKGVVTSLTKNHKKRFFITDPTNLLTEIKARENIAKEVIEEIKHLKKNQTTDISIQVLDGIVGSRVFYSLPEKHKNEIFYTFGGSPKMVSKYKPYLSQYADLYNSNNNMLKILKPEDYDFEAITDGQFNAECVQTNHPQENASCSIIADTVVFHVYEDNPKVIILKNKAISRILKNMFNDVWDKYSKKLKDKEKTMRAGFEPAME